MIAVEWRATRRTVAIALLSGIVWVRIACADDADAPSLPIAQSGDPAAVEAGKARFAQACSYCHGKEGRGGKTKSFRGRKDLEAQYVFDTISNGRKRGANIMPPWKSALSETQIWELVAYIRSLGNEPAND